MKREDMVEAMARAIEAIAWNDDPSGEPLNAHEDAAELAQAALSAIEAHGLAVVPVAPTEEMIGEGYSAGADMHGRDIWSAMLAASPIAGAPE